MMSLQNNVLECWPAWFNHGSVCLNMLQLNKFLLVLCAVCGVIASYFVSVFVSIIFIILVCIFLLKYSDKLQISSPTTASETSFTFPLWIRNIVNSLMNSYQLSKPNDAKPNNREKTCFSGNVFSPSLPSRSCYHASRYPCLDENTDYLNQRNGYTMCGTSPLLQSRFNNSLGECRSRGNCVNSLDNSMRTPNTIRSETSSFGNDFSCAPKVPPGERSRNCSDSDCSVKRVQTVAGPLLASSSFNKRKCNDIGLFVDANSPGLTSRLVQYQEESPHWPGSASSGTRGGGNASWGSSSSSEIWTHQPQYASPGQFPLVHLNRSQPVLPLLSSRNSQKAARRCVKVKIAAPDPINSRFPAANNKNAVLYNTTAQTDSATKSVIETLKEISRKRIHSQMEDDDDDAAKRQRCNEYVPTEPPRPSAPHFDSTVDVEMQLKRARDESPKQESATTSRPLKRIRNNEILSSLSSSRTLLESAGVKRKTRNLDWSRSSTPVLGKQQRTSGSDSSPSSSSRPTAAFGLPSTSQSSRRGSGSSGSSSRDPTEDGRPLPAEGVKKPGPSPAASKPPVAPVAAVASKPKPLERSLAPVLQKPPWHIASPFSSLVTDDDILDDVKALDDRLKEDRQTRLMSMMTVLSGGEPPLRVAAEKPEQLPAAPAPAASLSTATVTTSVLPTISSSSAQAAPADSTAASTAAASAPSPVLAFQPGAPRGSTAPTVSTFSPQFGFSQPSSASKDVATAVVTVAEAQTAAPVAASSGPAPAFPFGAASAGSVSSGSLAQPKLGSFEFGGSAPSSTGAAAAATAPVSTAEAAPVFGTAPAAPTAFSIAASANTTAIPTSVFGTMAPTNTPAIPTPVFGTATTNMPAIPTPAFGTATTNMPAIPTPTFGTAATNMPPIPTPVFGTAATNMPAIPTPVFGTAATNMPAILTPAFGTATTNMPAIPTPAFGTAATNMPAIPTPVFGTAATNMPAIPTPVFGTAATNMPAIPTPVFGTAATNMPAIPTTVFGNVAATTAPLFGSQANPTTHVFGAAASAPATPSTARIPVPVFGTAAGTPPVFGTAAVATPVFGSATPTTPAATTATPVFGSGATTTPTATITPLFGSGTPSFVPKPAPAAPNPNPAAVTSVGGFKFDFSNKATAAPAPLFPSAPAASSAFGSGSSANVTGAAEPKPFQFGASKLADKSFAFGTSGKASEAKAPEGQLKQGPFSFGAAGGDGSAFSAPRAGPFSFQPGSAAPAPGFPGAPAPAATTASAFSLQPQPGSSAPNPAFSLSANPPSAFPAQQNAGAGFLPAAPFFAPAQSAAPKAPMFAFGSSQPAQAVASSPFAFGGGAAPAKQAEQGALLGQPAPHAEGQPAPFQFGGSSSTPQLAGGFTFGAQPTASASSPAFSSGGFSAAPTMFSIGSGSTAPRTRSSRTRRAK